MSRGIKLKYKSPLQKTGTMGGTSFFRRYVFMTNEILVGVLSFAGTLVGSFSGMKLMSYRIEQLEKKVDKHNNFAERIPILEEKISVANHRITDLEHEREREG